MTIERIVRDDGGITEKVTYTPEELAALDQAETLIAERAMRENGVYDSQYHSWWLQGILRREGLEGMLHWARTAPFCDNKPVSRGYC